MNDYEMMNHRVDQLRLYLDESLKKSKIEEIYREMVMAELLDTRRQITQADRQDQAKSLTSSIFPVDFLDV